MMKFDLDFERELNVQIKNSELSRKVIILAVFSFVFFLINIPLQVIVGIEGKRFSLTWRDLTQILTCNINFIGHISCILIVQYRAKKLRSHGQKYFRNAKQKMVKDSSHLENVLLFLGTLHSELCEAINDINGIYQGRLFVSCLTNFFRLASQLFNLLRNLQMNASFNIQFKIDLLILLTIILNVIFIVLIAIICEETKLQVSEISIFQLEINLNFMQIDEANKMISNLENNVNEVDVVNMVSYLIVHL